MFKSFRLAVLLAGFVLGTSVSAQQAPPDYDEGYADASAGAPDSAEVADPPSRVARLALIHGAVSFVPAGENDWVEAQMNRPLVTGDKLWTDNAARAELQLGDATIRADQQTSVNFLDLDDQNAQVEMTQGTINLRVRRLYDGQSYEVDTPTLAFVINRVGEYRVDIAPGGNGTMVTVFHGSGDAYGESGARFRVEEGQSVRFNDAQLHDYASNNVPNPDDFDRFCFARDASWDSSPSRQYVSEEVIGYDDLDANGSWSDEPDYGNVWYPSEVAEDWAPYSYGSWGWVGGYGWTWVDSAPWGFAPFHYGRWAYIHNRWGWCPGPIHGRPYYAPALVAFLGGGTRGFSAGAPVGWFPLGPRDVYVPGYRVSRGYFTRVNVYAGLPAIALNNYYVGYARGNFDYARISYANRNVARAVTAVPGNVFIGARQIRGATLPVTRDTFVRSRVSGFAAIAPTRESLAFGGARTVGVPHIAANRKVIAATRPPPPVMPFAEREAALQRDPGRALPTREVRSVSLQAGGAQTLRGDHANVDVVTTSGHPARLPAQTLGPRGQVQPGQTNPGFPSADRDLHARESTDASTQSRTIDSQSRFNRPTENTQRTGQDTQIPHGPQNEQSRVFEAHENVDGAAQQQYRSAPVEHGPQPRSEVQDYRSGAVNHTAQTPQFQQPLPQPTPQVQTQSGQEYRRVQHPPYSLQPSPPQPAQELERREGQPREVRQPPVQQDFRQPQPQEYRSTPQQQQFQQQPPPRGQQREQSSDGGKQNDGQQHGRKSNDDRGNNHR